MLSLNRNLQRTIEKAFAVARENRYEYVTVEQLLLALLDNPEARSAIGLTGAGLDNLKKDLRNFIASRTPTVPSGQNEFEVVPTRGFERIIQRALKNSSLSEPSEVNGLHVLTSLLSEKDSHAVFYLTRHGIGSDPADNSDPSTDLIFKDQEDELEDEEEEDGLQGVLTNLNRQALKGRFGPLIGRELEFERMTQVLCRKNKNNPLLVGDAGVGKTVMVEGFARALMFGQVPPALAEATLYSVDVGALVAGTRYRGDFENRLKQMLRYIAAKEHSILFIDEIHTIVGAGATTGNNLDTANLIKPLLVSGDLRCIGATTYSEFRRVIEGDPALARRFQKIDIEEPDRDQSVAILNGIKSGLERHHGVSYLPSAIRAAVDLSDRFIQDRRLPDKAIDVLDDAGARIHLQRLSKKNKRKSQAQEKQRIGASLIADCVATTAKVPLTEIEASKNSPASISRLDRELRKRIHGQGQAIDALLSAWRVSRAGLGRADHPLACLMFAGPTGVGKTELARQFAELLNMHFERFDMSEYMERHSVSRLIGAPPGYVGHDRRGLLTEAILRRRHSLLLLDEIEKAHPDVCNLLLQVMDRGILTDAAGQSVDFRDVVLIMTTNSGAAFMGSETPGFLAPSGPSGHNRPADQELEQQFTPEFRNRLDAIVQFNALDIPALARVIDQMIDEVRASLVGRDVELQVKPDARSWLAQKALISAQGARELLRLIHQKIKDPLALAILSQKRGFRLVVSVKTEGDSSNLHVQSETRPLKEKKHSTESASAPVVPR